MSNVPPLPPLALRERVGCLPSEQDDVDGYLEFGRQCRAAVERVLPQGWSWDGKKVLDFGCGAGRTLRHFADVADRGEFWGTDIDRPSYEWGESNLVPPFTIRHNNDVPPLSVPENHFDLAYAISVFSHLSTSWADWLVEMHRVLAPGGLLVATFMGEGLSERIAGLPWDEDRVGMSVYQAGLGWDQGGPMVLLSPWWISEHWGRLFEIDRIVPRDFGNGARIFGPHDHGIIVARKCGRSATPEQLRQPSLRDPREVMALAFESQRLTEEVASLRPQVKALHEHAGYVAETVARLENEQRDLRAQIAGQGSSGVAPLVSGRQAASLLREALRRRGAGVAGALGRR